MKTSNEKKHTPQDLSGIYSNWVKELKELKEQNPTEAGCDEAIRLLEASAKQHSKEKSNLARMLHIFSPNTSYEKLSEDAFSAVKSNRVAEICTNYAALEMGVPGDPEKAGITLAETASRLRNALANKSPDDLNKTLTASAISFKSPYERYNQICGNDTQTSKNNTQTLSKEDVVTAATYNTMLESMKHGCGSTTEWMSESANKAYNIVLLHNETNKEADRQRKPLAFDEKKHEQIQDLINEYGNRTNNFTDRGLDVSENAKKLTIQSTGLSDIKETTVRQSTEDQKLQTAVNAVCKYYYPPRIDKENDPPAFDYTKNNTTVATKEASDAFLKSVASAQSHKKSGQDLTSKDKEALELYNNAVDIISDGKAPKGTRITIPDYMYGQAPDGKPKFDCKPNVTAPDYAGRADTIEIKDTKVKTIDDYISGIENESLRSYIKADFVENYARNRVIQTADRTANIDMNMHHAKIADLCGKDKQMLDGQIDFNKLSKNDLTKYKDYANEVSIHNTGMDIETRMSDTIKINHAVTTLPSNAIADTIEKMGTENSHKFIKIVEEKANMYKEADEKRTRIERTHPELKDIVDKAAEIAEKTKGKKHEISTLDAQLDAVEKYCAKNPESLTRAEQIGFANALKTQNATKDFKNAAMSDTDVKAAISKTFRDNPNYLNAAKDPQHYIDNARLAAAERSVGDMIKANRYNKAAAIDIQQNTSTETTKQPET
ncbi:MAG: hypothetical protein K6C13_15575 [Oscillospiraceae bacterium]|nr:hypothetical protein [Oscillospiraceae bacterium]